MQTIQQERAKFALERVQKAVAEKVDGKDYKSYASALPAMIHINGLGQAAAFYKSKVKKENDAYDLIYKLLSDWLTKVANQPYTEWLIQEKKNPNSKIKEGDLIDCIVYSDMHTYRLAQAEAQALMDWVKKFAKAYMED
jgi:CRISPR-associated protein Cmr5